jgi:hypothetical protein
LTWGRVRGSSVGVGETNYYKVRMGDNATTLWVETEAGAIVSCMLARDGLVEDVDPDAVVGLALPALDGIRR